MPELTMGSLFDGIGGFPLAAVRNGITPVWASEIEHAVLLVRNIAVGAALVLFIASLLHAPMEALLKGIAYFFGAAAYFCEIVLLTDCFTAKVPHKELFMAYCFGPMYILLGLSYLLGH